LGQDLREVHLDRRERGRDAGLVDRIGLETRSYVVRADVDRDQSLARRMSLEVLDGGGELRVGWLVAGVGLGRVQHGLDRVAGTSHLLEFERHTF
jgi:hypothetical protein